MMLLVRFLFRLVGFRRKVERDKSKFWKKPSQRGGLSGLARACKHGHRPRFRRLEQPALNVS